MSLATTFSALKHRNYRLWFWGQMVSLFGTWMQSTAQSYLIFQLTGSPVYLGYVAFAAGVPTWLLMLYGGVIADRVPRRDLLVITQTSMMGLAFILGGLTFTGLVQPWHIIALAFALGIANAFDAPARQSFVLEMVQREDLVNAIALNSAMFNTATAVGPAVAGLTYALLGPGWCFMLNGASFIAVIGALLLMHITLQPKPARRNSAIEDLKEGVRYVASHTVIRSLIALVGAISLFGVSAFTLIPAWAVTVLGGDATTNGLLVSARGVGAMSGALLIASLGNFTWRGKLLTAGTFVFPAMMLVFAQMRWLPLSLLTLVGTGMAQILILNLANSLLQTQVSDELRGRVMGIYSLIFFGLMPIGGLLAGVLADLIDEPSTVMLGAGISLVVVVLIRLLVPRLQALE
jgi:MFS family permease